jgi:hypothetical protein
MLLRSIYGLKPVPFKLPDCPGAGGNINQPRRC